MYTITTAENAVTGKDAGAWVDLAVLGFAALEGVKTGMSMTKGPVVQPALEAWKGPVDYSSLPEPKKVGEGKKFTPAQLKAAKELNVQRNNGVLRSDADGTVMNPSKQSKKGVPADMQQAEGDHITPRSRGGSNSNSNLQLITKEQNLKKGKKP